MKRWNVRLTDFVIEQLAQISDQREKEIIRTKLRQLEVDPDKQGKRLVDELTGCRVVRAAGQRYRIIYRMQAEHISVLVVFIGRRKEGDKKDVYTLAQKLARLGLLE